MTLPLFYYASFHQPFCLISPLEHLLLLVYIVTSRLDLLLTAVHICLRIFLTSRPLCHSATSTILVSYDQVVPFHARVQSLELRIFIELFTSLDYFYFEKVWYLHQLGLKLGVTFYLKLPDSIVSFHRT